MNGNRKYHAYEFHLFCLKWQIDLQLDNPICDVY
jgi:hypothetical protein